MVRLLSLFLAFLISTACVADTIEPYRALAQLRTPEGQGSGTLIAKAVDGRGLILTCRHVAWKKGDPILVSFLWAGGGDTIEGVIVEVIQGDGFDTDQALVMVPRVPVGVKPRKVVRFDQTRGPWIAAGFRAGSMRITPVIYEAIQYPNGLIIVPAPFIGGMSGGALFDRHGNVVAIVVASDLVTTGVAANGDILHNMVGKFLNQER